MRSKLFLTLVIFWSFLVGGGMVQTVSGATGKQLMVVFIHGTLFPFPSLKAFGSSLHTFLEKGRRLKRSWYQLYLDQTRSNSVYKHQFIDKEGLCKINLDGDILNGRYPFNIIGAQIYQVLTKKMPACCYDNVNLYTFGWDGRLDKSNRRQWADTLYESLVKETNALKKNKKGDALELVVVTHSHGGNVALNLADVYEKTKQKLAIDKLVLLGNPVQKETENFVASPLFKKIYNFYSRGDSIQTMDFISTSGRRSRRCFKTADINNADTTKIVQIEVKVAARSPTHAELWLFGSPEHDLYRKSLPTYPLPVAAFLPVILSGIDTTLPKAEDALLVLNRKGPLYTLKIEDRDPDVRSVSSMKVVMSVRAADLDPYLVHIVKE